MEPGSLPAGRAWVRALPALALALAPAAHAGRTAHLLTEESQIVPEGGVELEQWVWGEGTVPAAPTRGVIDWLWWGPVIGLSPHWELAVPLQLIGDREDIGLASIQLDARYRIFARQDDEGFQPLIRLSYVHTLNEYAGPPRLELNLVGTYGGPNDARLTVNLGGKLGLPALGGSSAAVSTAATGSLGASLPLPHGLRIAAELAAELPITSTPPSLRLYVGPSVAWTHGPFWVTFGSLFGLTDASSRIFPKVLWAVAL